MHCENNGHGIECEFDNGYYVNDDNGDHFQAAQFHIHVLSEEMLPRLGDVISLHIVHFQNPAPSANKIAISVIGILFKIGSASPLLEPIVQKLVELQYEGNGTTIDFPGFQQYFSDIRTQNKDSYWNYPGSLTTPPCSERIDWTVMEFQPTLSQSQFDSLIATIRLVTHSATNKTNNRPIQRQLQGVPYYPGGPRSISHGPTASSIALAVIVAVLLLVVFVLIILLVVKSMGSSEPHSYSNIQ
jgi:carbonic anhydrase